MNEYNEMPAKSIVEETEHGYISYGNLHDNDDRGLKLIAEALKKQMLPIKANETKMGKEWYSCPECGGVVLKMNKHCYNCGHAFLWEEVE